MNKLLLATAALTLLPGHLLSAAPSAETLTALGEVRALSDKVKGFRADLQVTDKQGAQEVVTTSTLLVSKDHGWKVDSSSAGTDFQLICDFKTFYQVMPSQKEAVKHIADTPEATALFRKPVTDLNPLSLLDPNSL